jgi:DNA-binding response OmpR family regulator
MADDGPILLIEDDVGLRTILARHLRAMGYDVREAGSAEDGVVELDRRDAPHLVVLDLNLPGDTGWDLIRGPALARAGSPPVVISSATTIDPRRLREFGIAGYLPKPYALETLVATIERVLQEQRPK